MKRSRRRWPWIVLVVFVVAIVVDGATHSGERTRAGPQRAPARVAVSAGRQLLVAPGAPNTARAVLDRFASAYGQVSGRTVAERYRLLLALAAPPLLSQLRAAGPQGGLNAFSSVLRRTSVDSLLVDLQLTPASGGSAHGSVAIEQWPVGPGDSQVPPMRSSYAAELIQVGGAWRVSEFGAAS